MIQIVTTLNNYDYEVQFYSFVFFHSEYKDTGVKDMSQGHRLHLWNREH